MSVRQYISATTGAVSPVIHSPSGGAGSLGKITAYLEWKSFTQFSVSYPPVFSWTCWYSFIWTFRISASCTLRLRNDRWDRCQRYACYYPKSGVVMRWCRNGPIRCSDNVRQMSVYRHGSDSFIFFTTFLFIDILCTDISTPLPLLCRYYSHSELCLIHTFYLSPGTCTFSCPLFSGYSDSNTRNTLWIPCFLSI